MPPTVPALTGLTYRDTLVTVQKPSGYHLRVGHSTPFPFLLRSLAIATAQRPAESSLASSLL